MRSLSGCPHICTEYLVDKEFHMCYLVLHNNAGLRWDFSSLHLETGEPETDHIQSRSQVSREFPVF